MSLKDIIQGKPLGHPSHPLFVHFPTALFPTSLLFDLLSWSVAEPALVKSAFYTVIVGLAGALVAMLTGYVDYFGMVAGSTKHRVATWHWMINVPVVLLFGLSLGLRTLALDATRTPWSIVIVSLIGVPLLLVGNYFGGELVYRMGMRVSTGRRETPTVIRAIIRLQNAPLLKNIVFLARVKR